MVDLTDTVVYSYPLHKRQLFEKRYSLKRFSRDSAHLDMPLSDAHRC